MPWTNSCWWHPGEIVKSDGVCGEKGNEHTMSSAAMENIETIARLEEEFIEQRTFWNRVSDAIAHFTGSVKFVALHFTWFIAWFWINSGRFPGIRPFDPYPFVLLGMTVSCEAVILSTFVLMSQNRMTSKNEQRDQLHLQIALLAEKELSKLLQTQQRLSEHLGVTEVAQDKEVSELSEETAVDTLARELKRKLPTDSV
jgi:uncharacterized membrane protein